MTPHIFVVDGKGVVRYRGYVDDSAKPEERQHTGLHDALESLLGNKDVAVTATKAFGCTIKFKTGGVSYLSASVRVICAQILLFPAQIA